MNADEKENELDTQHLHGFSSAILRELRGYLLPVFIRCHPRSSAAPASCFPPPISFATFAIVGSSSGSRRLTIPASY